MDIFTKAFDEYEEVIKLSHEETTYKTGTGWNYGWETRAILVM